MDAINHVVVYGPGGHDPKKPNNNIVEEYDVPVPVETLNRDAILTAARTALATNRTFVALASPSTAQVVAQVKALTRQINALARLEIGQFDGTD